MKMTFGVSCWPNVISRQLWVLLALLARLLFQRQRLRPSFRIRRQQTTNRWRHLSSVAITRFQHSTATNRCVCLFNTTRHTDRQTEKSGKDFDRKWPTDRSRMNHTLKTKDGQPISVQSQIGAIPVWSWSLVWTLSFLHFFFHFLLLLSSKHWLIVSSLLFFLVVVVLSSCCSFWKSHKKKKKQDNNNNKKKKKQRKRGK